MGTRIGAALLSVTLWASLAGGCNPTRHSDFPLEVGFTPIEATSILAQWPAPTATDPHPQGLGFGSCRGDSTIPPRPSSHPGISRED